MDIFMDLLTDPVRWIHPFTVSHMVFFLVVSISAFYITEYLLQIKWFRWTYISIVVLTIISMLHQGDKKDAAKDVFKLATL